MHWYFSSDRISSFKLRNWSFAISLIALAFLVLDPVRIVERHTISIGSNDENAYRQQYMGSIAPMDELAARLEDPERTAIFNFPRNHYLQFMFDHGYSTWDKMPTEVDVERLRSNGYTVYALQDGRSPAEFPENVIVISDSVVSLPRLARL